MAEHVHARVRHSSAAARPLIRKREPEHVGATKVAIAAVSWLAAAYTHAYTLNMHPAGTETGEAERGESGDIKGRDGII